MTLISSNNDQHYPGISNESVVVEIMSYCPKEVYLAIGFAPSPCLSAEIEGDNGKSLFFWLANADPVPYKRYFEGQGIKVHLTEWGCIFFGAVETPES